MNLKILMIDNSIKGQDVLEDFLNSYGTVKNVKYTVLHEVIKNFDKENFDLIVLSGSENTPLGENELVYKDEIELIKTTSIPIIGICFGFELIATSYGDVLVENESQIEGIHPIVLSKIFFKRDKDNVWQNFKYKLEKTENFEVLAENENGHMIINAFDKNIYGLQFHPERKDDQNSGYIIFEDIIKDIFEYRNN